jgi:pyruvate/2-oxoglutarate dehydrogenase complex dihydrolipoamide dehydrogenase (E3) component
VEVITHGKSLRIEPGPRLVMDTRTIEADLIILATGVKPNVSFLEGTGVEVRSGIVIDEHMRTTVPGIYAAGDVARGATFPPASGWCTRCSPRPPSMAASPA